VTKLRKKVIVSGKRGRLLLAGKGRGETRSPGRGFVKVPQERLQSLKLLSWTIFSN